MVNGSVLDNLTTSNTDNSFGELESNSADFNSTQIYSAVYTRDKLGRISSKTETIDGITTVYNYEFDLTGRLYEYRIDGAIEKTWSYDSNNNITHENSSLIASFDDQDRIESQKGILVVHDDNGYLQSKSNSGAITSFDYDLFGNLRNVTLPDGTEITYLID